MQKNLQLRRTEYYMCLYSIIYNCFFSVKPPGKSGWFINKFETGIDLYENYPDFYGDELLSSKY